MTFIKKDSDLWRRLRFYGFGLLMGCFLVSVITKGKACQMPGTLKLEELNSQTIIFSKQANCSMQCRGINQEDVKYLLKGGSVNLGKSEVHAKPNPNYAVDGYTKNHHHLRIMIADCGDTSKIISTIDLASENDSCHCN